MNCKREKDPYICEFDCFFCVNLSKRHKILAGSKKSELQEKWLVVVVGGGGEKHRKTEKNREKPRKTAQ